MRNKNALAEIAAIRSLQCVAAEAEAARAASTSRAKQAQVENSERQRMSAEENWRQTMTAPSLSLEIANLWSAELLHQEDVTKRVTLDAAGAAAELQRATRGWHACVMRRDVADRLAGKAATLAINRRDDAALQEALDRFGGRDR